MLDPLYFGFLVPDPHKSVNLILMFMAWIQIHFFQGRSSKVLRSRQRLTDCSWISQDEKMVPKNKIFHEDCLYIYKWAVNH